jgi:hypothetical protein
MAGYIATGDCYPCLRTNLLPISPTGQGDTFEGFGNHRAHQEAGTETLRWSFGVARSTKIVANDRANDSTEQAAKS